MANIGRVYQDSYVNKAGVKTSMITMDIRTLSFRKKFTIAVNKLKYPDGVVNANIVQGKEDHPDYHIWYNMSNRGESIPSEIVGNVRNAVSDNGLAYKRATLFDPFLSKENIYFTLFAVDQEKKIDKDHLYNVVCQPYRKMNDTSNESRPSEPSYDYPPSDNNAADDDENPF